MTPDKQGYLPCPTCGVLAPVDRPHSATFCARERPVSLIDGLESEEELSLEDGLSTGPEPVTSDDPTLWGGT